ncbi:amino acid ABC transporter permease [Phyllobacterium sp. SL163]|uniref:amino acid ABC transporter permease n=1 Tax=unclassified Phyllobacterium TaxID=2638441 RepID=UPI003CE8FD6E
MLDVLLSLLKGIPATLMVTVGAFVLGAIIAVPLVLMRRSRSFPLRLIARVYIDVFRGIPPVVWLFIIFFGIGSGFLRFTSLQAAILGLGLVSSAYLAEIYRGGFLALPLGQSEAAIAMGMTRTDVLRFILGPQVFRVCLPPMATFLVSLLKDGTVASTIGVRDVMMLVSQEAQKAGGGFTPFLFAALLYILLSIPVAYYSRAIDEALRRRIAR